MKSRRAITPSKYFRSVESQFDAAIASATFGPCDIGHPHVREIITDVRRLFSFLQSSLLLTVSLEAKGCDGRIEYQ
jgi:hypothetical protein